jgi:hypothetical protein
VVRPRNKPDSARRPNLARSFANDPLAAVLSVLQELSGTEGLRAEDVKAALRARGVPEESLAMWRRVQARLVAHDQVQICGDRYHRTYRWLAEKEPLSAAQALVLLAGRLPATRRAELVEVVRSALTDGTESGNGAWRQRESRLEQREKDAVRALAEMAIEVEELATNQASARALVHTVRALTKVAELQPIERAGQSATFNRNRHVSVGGPIADGAPVLVVRPGYLWNKSDGEILIARAVVQDRSTS